jgi:hypothetical protein
VNATSAARTVVQTHRTHVHLNAYDLHSRRGAAGAASRSIAKSIELAERLYASTGFASARRIRQLAAVRACFSRTKRRDAAALLWRAETIHKALALDPPEAHGAYANLLRQRPSGAENNTGGR